MTDYVPLYISLAIVFVFGITLPLVLVGFVPETYNPESVISPYINIVQYGINGTAFTIPIINYKYNYSFDYFAFLGDTLRGAYINYLNVMSWIPNYILIPIFVFVIVGTIYTIAIIVGNFI